jgi:hypothetical protein
MERSNTHNMHGFSFIEVILAIAMLGAVVTPVLMVQYNVLGFLTRSSDKIRSIFLVDALYSWAVLEEKKGESIKKLEKNYTDPTLKTSYEVGELPEKSPLKNMKHLLVARVNGTWQRGGGTQSQQEISFLFNPPQEKKDEEKGGAEKEKAESTKTKAEPTKEPAAKGNR